MTESELRTIISNSLGSTLGTYTTPGGQTTPAIFVGEPPNDWVASGVEVRISKYLDTRISPAYAPDVTKREAWQVRLVSHDGVSLRNAVDVLTRVFRTATFTLIPGNERLGILGQYAITIPD